MVVVVVVVVVVSGGGGGGGTQPLTLTKNMPSRSRNTTVFTRIYSKITHFLARARFDLA